MDDIDRIQEMVAEGRISPADGDRLIEVLRDIDAADFALDSAASAPAHLASSPTADAPQAPSADAATEPAEPAAANPPSAAAADSAAASEAVERRRERFEEYERRRLERLQRDAERRQERAERDLERLERSARRDAERAQRDEQRQQERETRDAERQRLVEERERLREAVRNTTRAANEAAREASRRAQDVGWSVAETARAAGQEAVDAVRAIGQQVGANLGGDPQPAKGAETPPEHTGQHADAAARATAAATAAHAATGQAATTQTAPAAGGSGAPMSTRRIAPAGTRWVTVEVLAGDIDVHAVAGLQRPEVVGSGSIHVSETDYGFLIRQAPERGSILDRFLAHVRSDDVVVKIPADHGLNIRATAGDIDLHGVKYLQGRVTAGDISASGLEGIDFTTMAGDVDVSLRLKEGEHSLTGATGDLDVVLSPDSDVTVDGSVSIGDAHSNHPSIGTNRQVLGERIAGTLGSGAASLNLRVTTGDLGIKVAAAGRDG